MFLLYSGNISESRENNRACRIETSEIERDTLTKALPEVGKFFFFFNKITIIKWSNQWKVWRLLSVGNNGWS